jgi:hypothetical protein
MEPHAFGRLEKLLCPLLVCSFSSITGMVTVLLRASIGVCPFVPPHTDFTSLEKNAAEASLDLSFCATISIHPASSAVCLVEWIVANSLESMSSLLRRVAVVIPAEPSAFCALSGCGIAARLIQSTGMVEVCLIWSLFHFIALKNLWLVGVLMQPSSPFSFFSSSLLDPCSAAS